jgi:rod shape-determining protein MreC
MAVFRRQRSPQLFSSRPAGAVRTLLLVAASIVLMVYDHQSGNLQRMHAALSTLVYPVQAVVNAPYAIADWSGRQLATHNSLVSENVQLKQQLLDMRVQLQQLASLEQENARLLTLMQGAVRLNGRISDAKLLDADLDPFRHLVLINKGTSDGVFDGQTILDASGIVGQVTRTQPLVSEVTLITDPSQAIQVEINRTGLRTLAVGTTNIDELSLPYLTNSADVKAGDLLVSSGLSGRYPPGYPVAVVTKIERNPAEPFAAVSAHTAAALNHGHDVLLYWPPQQAAIAPSPVRTELPKVTVPKATGKNTGRKKS